MPRPKTPIKIELTDDERDQLERLSRSQIERHRTVVRAKIVLLLSEGKSVSAVARAIGGQRRIVRKWAKRFIRKRLKGLADLPRSGAPARFSPVGRYALGQAGL